MPAGRTASHVFLRSGLETSVPVHEPKEGSAGQHRRWGARELPLLAALVGRFMEIVRAMLCSILSSWHAGERLAGMPTRPSSPPRSPVGSGVRRCAIRATVALACSSNRPSQMAAFVQLVSCR